MNTTESVDGLDVEVGTSRLAQLGIGLAILLVGVAVTVGLVAGRDSEEPTIPEPKSTAVEVITARPGQALARVETTGVLHIYKLQR